MSAMKLEILEILRTKSHLIKKHLRLTYGEDLVKYNSETPAALKKIVVSTVYLYKFQIRDKVFATDMEKILFLNESNSKLRDRRGGPQICLNFNPILMKYRLLENNTEKEEMLQLILLK